jgi:hypothetical protein
MVSERPADRPASMGLIVAQLPALHDDIDESITDCAAQDDVDFNPLPFIKLARQRATASTAA